MTKLELLLLVLAIFGGIDLAARGAELLLKLYPRLLSARARMWRLLADVFVIPSFRRRAIATRVEEVVNQTAFGLHRDLPKGWVKRAKIRWVRNSKSAEIRDGTIVLRVRPATDPDNNLMQTLLVYFKSAIFPDSRDILPDDIVSATALAITRASLERNHQYLLAEFDTVLLPSIGAGKQGLLDQYADCVRLNDFGFLMGPFVREVDHVANRMRFSSSRTQVPATIAEILNHMLAFQPLVRVADSEWIYAGTFTSYGFMLVSRPPSTRPGIEAYVKRAQAHVKKEVQRIYVVGRGEEREFVLKVIRALLGIRELRGFELFSLYRDYRGDPNGLGCLLGLDNMLAALNLSLRSVGPLHEDQSSDHSDCEQGLGDASQNENKADAQVDLSKISEDLIIQLSDFEGAWITLAQFGSALRTQIPGFTPQRYGGRNLISVLKDLDILEFDERGAGPAKVVYVRLRANDHNRGFAHRNTATNDRFRASVMEIVREHCHEDGWIFLGTLGHFMRAQSSDFSLTSLGATSLHDLISRIPELEMQERGAGHSKTYVRVRSDGATS